MRIGSVATNRPHDLETTSLNVHGLSIHLERAGQSQFQRLVFGQQELEVKRATRLLRQVVVLQAALARWL